MVNKIELKIGLISIDSFNNGIIPPMPWGRWHAIFSGDFEPHPRIGIL
jgi:hypothetical protein